MERERAGHRRRQSWDTPHHAAGRPVNAATSAKKGASRESSHAAGWRQERDCGRGPPREGRGGGEESRQTDESGAESML